MRSFIALTLALMSSNAVAGGGANCGFGDFNLDKEVIRLFPTYAVVDQERRAIHIPVRVWVFEPEVDDRLRKFAIKTSARALELDDTSRAVYERRARAFMVDNERGERVRISVYGGPKIHLNRTLGPTGKDGQLETVLELSVPEGVTIPEVLKVSLGSPDQEARAHSVDVPVLSAQGLTVISDIDDTIKVTNVVDKRELLKNTLAREFRPVAGMAARFSTWAERGAAFHYVSASPWALQHELAFFAETEGFPSGVYHLRSLRFKDVSRTATELLDSRAHKVASIETLMARFPARRFILVGDTGERDPEIYGEIARRFGARVEHVYVREVKGADNSAARLSRALKGARYTTLR